MNRVVLLGHPVSHSFSPVIQRVAFEQAGLNWRYEAIDTPPAELPATIERMRGEAWAGANVTLPLKESVIPLLDGVDPSGEETSAVNTIVTDGGRLVGYNTDLPGFLGDLQSKWVVPKQGTCLILGAGGAARAVAYGLARHGLSLRLIARTESRAEVLADEISRAHGSRAEALPWSRTSFQDSSGNCVLVVNATPVGMPPAEQESPWPSAVPLPPAAFIYDLVYLPGETRLVASARAAGLPSASGAGMLVEQGALSYEHWTGRKAPRERMRAALDAALEQKLPSKRSPDFSEVQDA